MIPPQRAREAVYNQVILEQQSNFPTQNGVRFHVCVCICVSDACGQDRGWDFIIFLLFVLFCVCVCACVSLFVCLSACIDYDDQQWWRTANHEQNTMDTDCGFVIKNIKQRCKLHWKNKSCFKQSYPSSSIYRTLNEWWEWCPPLTLLEVEVVCVIDPSHLLWAFFVLWASEGTKRLFWHSSISSSSLFSPSSSQTVAIETRCRVALRGMGG